MRRWALTVLTLAGTAAAAPAHFIWIVPGAPADGKATAQVIFSDSLRPDGPELLARIKQTELFARSADGKTAPVKWTDGKDAYHVKASEKGPSVVGGVCRYGLFQRGEAPPFLLMYYPKALLAAPAHGTPLFQQAADRLPLEIVPAKDAGTFVVLWQGKPLAGADVVILVPGKDKDVERKTDKQGAFTLELAGKGVYGMRVRHTEAKEGEHDGKPYKEVRHHATLAFEHGEARPGKAPEYPPLPQAVSSLGAAVADGWLYVYGGHSGQAHHYSTETVVGTFRRLKLSDPKGWEDLPSGPGLQGLALVAHGGKLYRLGGMQPRNKPGEVADTVSVAACARYDPAAKKWEALPDLPEGRSSHDAVAVGDKIVVAGGWKLNGAGKKPEWHGTVLVLDLTQQPLKWQSVKQPFQRRALTAAAHGGKVYVIAGLSEGGDLERTVNVYDPAKDEWSSGPEVLGP